MAGITTYHAHRWDEVEGVKGYRRYRCRKCGFTDSLLEIMNTVCPVKGDDANTD